MSKQSILQEHKCERCKIIENTHWFLWFLSQWERKSLSFSQIIIKNTCFHASFFFSLWNQNAKVLKRVPLILKDLAGFNFTWNCCFFSMKWILNFFQEGRLGEESWRCCHTVWKFEDFSTCKILREINFAIDYLKKSQLLILVNFDPKKTTKL